MASEGTYIEEHPPGAIVIHWVHLISIAVLVFTGFFIHWPASGVSLSLMRQLHFVFMFVLIFTAIARVYYAFATATAPIGSTVKRRDAHWFGYERENKGTFLETLKYYLFIRKTHPPVQKYNPLQKGTYMAWLLLIALQALTGFSIWTPTAEFLRPLTYLLGGPQYMRMYHYLIMWLFIITVLIHVYLSVAESIWQLPLMFFGKEHAPEEH